MRSGLWAIAVALCLHKNINASEEAIIFSILALCVFIIMDIAEWIIEMLSKGKK